VREKVVFSQNWKFCEVEYSLTKLKIKPLKRLKYFEVSTGAYKETKNHQKTTPSHGTFLTTSSSGGNP
jgi:hypothetical protein